MLPPSKPCCGDPVAIGAYGRKTKNPVIIIRAGEDAKEYPDDFDSQTVCTMEDDEFATFEGNAKESVLGENYVITNERLRAAIRVANRMTGRPVRFMRRGDDPRWLMQVSGIDSEGPIQMSVKKEKLHDIEQIFKADGSLNVLHGMTGLTHFLGQHAAGHVAISQGKVTVTSQDDGSENVVIFFNRK